jgi:MFS family permease
MAEVTGGAGTGVPEGATGNRRLAILLAMAMFVLVVDTSLMNVSISSVVRDLDTTVSGVQSAIALEALVSAAFILISSKVGDLIGRKRAYVLGLLGYAIGALAMTLAQGLTAIIIFWAVLGGIGASLLLPAMQSLVHGNFEGAAQKQAYALVGAAAAIAAAVGPLLGGLSPPSCRGASGSCSRSSSSRSCCPASGWSATRRTPGLGASTPSVRSSPSSAWAASCWASWCGRRAASPWARSS